MTVEEYLDLVERAAQGGKQVVRGVRKVSKAVKKARSSKKDPKMAKALRKACLLYTSPSPRDKRQSRMPSSA